MTGEWAGAADILTGAAIAQAVEPDAGEGRVAGHGDCLNCGTTLIGAHCHACGQKSNVHRTLHAFGDDFLHSVLHFEGKIWRTLPMLFWRPGDLTRRYVHGERAKFVSPLALFLFTVFLTFAAFNWLVPGSGEFNSVVDAEQAEREYQADRKEILNDIAELQVSRKTAETEGQAGRESMDGEIARYQRDLKVLDDGRGKEIRQSELAQRKIAKARADTEANVVQLKAQLQSARKAGKSTKAIEEEIESQMVDAQVMNSALSALGQEDKQKIEGNWRFTDLDFRGAKSLNKAAKHALENPQLVLYKIQSNTYKFSWALIPISEPFVWLLFFWHRRFKVFDHAVFVTYSLTFMMLLGILCALLIQFPATEAIGGLALIFIPPIHMYRQLRHAYQTSRAAALLRTFALSGFAVVALTLFAILIVTLGVTG